MKRSLIALSMVSALACAQTLGQANVFRFKPGDGLKVVVLGFSEYQGDYVVLSDGTVSGIGFGNLKLEGLTISQAQDQITTRMKRYVRDPKVSIVITQERQQAVFVVRGDGDASASTSGGGGYPFQPNLELRQVIAMSKMPSPLDMFETRIYRQGKQVATVDLAKLMKGDGAQWNGPMQPGDLVTIMPVPLVRVWVLGLVRSPGEKRIRSGADIFQAIASAGEITAEPSVFDEIEITVRRGPENYTFAPRRDFGNNEFMLQDGDTVVVQPPQRLKVSVSGYVAKPGDFGVREGTTLPQLVGATAGGVTQDGTGEGVLIFRNGEVLVGNANPSPTEPGMPILNGDSVYVLRNERGFYVMGKVIKPGLVPMIDGKNYRLIDAIGASGGLDPSGSLHRVTLMTNEGGKLVAKEYHLDKFVKDGDLSQNPALKDDDVVFVGTPKGITLQGVSQALSGALVVESLLRR